MVRLFRNSNRNRNRNDGNNAPPASVVAESDAASFLQQSQALIPAEVRMISGCEDEQTSADVYNSSGIGNGGGLPNPRGRAGGACTNALLELLHQKSSHEKLSFQQVLMQLRDKLSQQGHSQIPQLTSSRPLELDETPFSLIGNNPTSGARRALLVGINYTGQDGQLRGCHNDVYHMQDYLIQVQGFPPEDILILMDDNKHHYPSREKIVRALRHLVAVSQPGDAVFFHYSGHGGLLTPDFNSFKHKQQQQFSSTRSAAANATSMSKYFYDQTLIPVDHTRSGQIRDFSLFHHFVQPMKAGVVVTCLMDCCHSGSVLDLPYSFQPTNTGRGSSYGMTQNMTCLSNLAFLYLLAGGILPHGIFDNVTEHLQNTVDGDLSDYQGTMADTLDHDTAAVDGDDAGDYGDVDTGNGGDDFDGNVGGDNGEYRCDAAGDGFDAGDAADGNVVSGEDVPRGFGGDTGDYGGYGQGYDVSGDEGCGDEGCGDEGCGEDLFSTLADCLNDS